MNLQVPLPISPTSAHTDLASIGRFDPDEFDEVIVQTLTGDKLIVPKIPPLRRIGWLKREVAHLYGIPYTRQHLYQLHTDERQDHHSAPLSDHEYVPPRAVLLCIVQHGAYVTIHAYHTLVL
jgi:hypothetical protein